MEYVLGFPKRMADRLTSPIHINDRAFHTAIGNHPQRPVSAPALLLCCSEERRRRRIRMARIWSNIIAGELLIRDIPGNHSTMMREPHVRQVAAEILHYLNRADMAGRE